MKAIPSGPARPLLGIALLFAVMIAVTAVQKATGTRLVAAAQLGVLAVFVAAALWLLYGYWRAIDEAARDAQKTAWFWGGSLAMVPGIVLASMLGDAHFGWPDQLAVLAPNGNMVVAGALLLGLVQLVGFTLVWAGWWLVRR